MPRVKPCPSEGGPDKEGLTLSVSLSDPQNHCHLILISKRHITAL